jgi:HK97 family phage major capsid protein
VDLEAVLKRLTELAEKAAAGENVDEERKKLEAEKARLQREEDERAAKAADAEDTKGQKADDNSNESELDRLRREKRERDEREFVQSVVGKALEVARGNQDEQRKRMQSLAEEELAKALGGGALDETVRGLLASTRTESRFIGAGGDEDVAKAIAAGGTVDRNYAGGTQVAISKGAEAIFKRKSLAEFMSIVARASRPAMGILKPEEKEFLEWSQKAALAEGTTTAGGFLIHPEWMPDILGLLRGWAIVRQANPRIVPFSRLMNQTSISSGATAFYTAENAVISPSGMTFNEAPLLTPHNLTALVPVSNYLLNDAAAAEGIVRDDLAVVMGLREDLAFIQGVGTGGEPLGLRNISGITLNPLTVATNGIAVNLVNMRQIKNTVRSMNAVGARWAWFFNPALVSHLETLTDSFGRFLADTSILSYDEPNHSGTLDGVPFFTSNQIPINLTTGTSTNTTYLMLVNMSETIVGASQDLTLDVSSEASYTTDGGTTWVSTFQNNQTLFRAVMRHDINHRRPNQIIVQTGVIVP